MSPVPVVRRRLPSLLCTAALAGCVERAQPSGPGPGGGAEVLSVTSVPMSPSDVRLAVELSAPAPIAGACVRRDRPAEVHLVEAGGAASLELAFVGLAAATDYDCHVAPVDGSGAPQSVSFRTDDLPSEAATADVEGDPEAITGVYTVTSVRPECHGIHRNFLTVLDPEGNNRWHAPVPRDLNLGIEVWSDGHDRLLYAGGESTLGAPTVVDVVDGVQWQLSLPPSEEEVVFHHGGKRIADGRLLTLELNDAPGWEAFQLRLSNEDGETSWYFDAADAAEAGWLRDGSPEDDDPHHANWADVHDAGSGPVAYVSLCFAFQIVAIDATDGSPVWKFGYGGDFALEDLDGNPLPDDEFPECQHGVDVDGENLLIYDNGFLRGYTRVVEFALDTERRVATKTWEWLDDGFWEKYHGGSEWLTPDKQRVLVVEADNQCSEGAVRPSQIVEVDRATDTAVHRLVLRDTGHWIYNAHRLDGCDLFANAEYCPAVAERLDELRPVLGL